MAGQPGSRPPRLALPAKTMAELSELTLSTRLFFRTYRWRKARVVAPLAMTKPLSEASVALISSAGFVAPGQDPFDDGMRGGDFSHRILPADVDLRSLRESHRSDAFDHSGMRTDPNLAVPLQTLRELESEGTIGSVSAGAISLMGSITAPARLLGATVPLIVDILRQQKSDCALLVPV
jgi:D-proline reductase (dithiol) PrdB